MAIRLQIRRDTSTNFSTYNPTLAQGEISWEINTGKFKIGDGIRSYNDLPFIEISWGEITGDLANQTDLQNALDGKVDELSSPATAGTYTKVTINSDGLVSSGATLSASDIPDISATYYLASNPEGYTSNQGTVTSVNNVQPVNGNVTIEIPDSATWGNITGDIADQTDLSTALGNKVDKTSTANKVYGTDANGDQTTYDVDSFGQVDDVTVGGTSVVTNKVAVLGSMAGETASDYATAAQGALADSAVQTINNIAPIDGNAIIEAGTGLKLSSQNEFNILQEDERDVAVNVIGNVTNNNGVYSGFSNSDYLTIPVDLSISSTDSWEIQAKFNQYAQASFNRYVYYFSSNLYIFNIYCYKSTIGINGPNSYSARISDYSPPADVWVKVKRVVNSNNYVTHTEISTNGIDWTTYEEVTKSGAPSSSTFTPLVIGCQPDTTASYYFNGSVDLNHCYIKVNDVTIWDGSGIISKPVAKATNSLYGLVKPDGTSITVNDGVISASITDNVQSTSTTSALSANMGKELQDQVDNLKARGRFLALWDCSTGLAETHPTVSPYEYKAGDYFIVGTVAQAGGTNYKPSGSSYTDNVPSTAIETADVSVDDVYYYDGNVWHLQINTQKEIAFVNIAGDPYDNSNLASALNDKQDELPSQTGQSGKFLTTNGTAISWGDVDLSGYVTTNTAQDVTETKTFTTQQKLQSGQGDGCLVIGADVASNTVTANTRKLGRMVFHTNESTSLNCAFVSTDTQSATSASVIMNCVEFGGRPADTSSTSPDIMNFTVAKSHNATAVTDKIIALALTKADANFAVQPKYNGDNLITLGDVPIQGINFNGNDLIPDANKVVSMTATQAVFVDWSE